MKTTSDYNEIENQYIVFHNDNNSISKLLKNIYKESRGKLNTLQNKMNNTKEKKEFKINYLEREDMVNYIISKHLKNEEKFLNDSYVISKSHSFYKVKNSNIIKK